MNPGPQGPQPPLTTIFGLKGGRSRCMYWSSNGKGTVGIHMANLITMVRNLGARRWSLLMTIPRIMTLRVGITAPCCWSACSLMHLPALATSEALLTFASWIGGLKPLHYKLCLNWVCLFCFPWVSICISLVWENDWSSERELYCWVDKNSLILVLSMLK